MIKIILVLFFSLVLSLPSALSQTKSECEKIVSMIEEANSIGTTKKKSCILGSRRPPRNPLREPIKTEVSDSKNIEKPLKSIDWKSFRKVKIQDIHGRDLDVSVIPEEHINSIKELYPPFLIFKSRWEELCAVRSHTVGDSLGRAGVESVKLLVKPKWSLWGGNYIIPQGAKGRRTAPIMWEFHVANLVMVEKKDGTLEEYVLDSFLEGNPVPRSQWEKRLTDNPESSVGSTNVVSRYVVDDLDMRRKDLKYDEERLNRSYQILAN